MLIKRVFDQSFPSTLDLCTDETETGAPLQKLPLAKHKKGGEGIRTDQKDLVLLSTASERSRNKNSRSLHESSWYRVAQKSRIKHECGPFVIS